MTGNPKREAEMQYGEQAKLRVHTGKTKKKKKAETFKHQRLKETLLKVSDFLPSAFTIYFVLICWQSRLCTNTQMTLEFCSWLLQPFSWKFFKTRSKFNYLNFYLNIGMRKLQETLPKYR